MHRKAEEASEAEAEFKTERRGGRGFPLQVVDVLGIVPHELEG